MGVQEDIQRHMGFFKKLLYMLTTEWKTIKIKDTPTVSYIYRQHAPGPVSGITYQEDDWNGLRFDDHKGKCVANLHQSGYEKKQDLRGLDKCQWWGELVQDKNNPEMVVLRNVYVRKVKSIL